MSKKVKNKPHISDRPCVTIYTDGSYKGKLNSGGWSALMTYGNNWKLITNGKYETTINRMEITAVIESLRCLNTPCDVLIISDSQLTCNIINSYIYHWMKHGFVTAAGTPVANMDLITQLIDLMKIHNVKAQWVKAHTNNNDIDSLCNDICDHFAQASADKSAPKNKLLNTRRDHGKHKSVSKPKKWFWFKRYKSKK